MKKSSGLIIYPIFLALLFTLVNCDKDEPAGQAAIITLSTFNITTETADSGGNITSDGGEKITSRGVVWSTSENPSLDANLSYTTDGGGIGMFASLLTGLTPNTTYFLRAYAINNKGVIYGNEQQFTTEGATPDVTTRDLINITSYSFESGGIITSDGGAPIYSGGVVWSTSPYPTIDENSGYTSDGSEMGEYVSKITILSPGTTYYVRAYAANQFGTGYGEEKAITTKTDGNGQAGSGVTDINGNFYPSVIIGNQEWMAVNLRATHDAYGKEITRYCYDNEATNCNIYGGLYTWHTIMNGSTSNNLNPSNIQGICPTGWHLPSDAEWKELLSYVDAQGYPNEYENPVGAGASLKSCRQESSPLIGDCRTSEHPRWDSHSAHLGFNQFGFSALPGGTRHIDSSFIYIGTTALWWSTTENSSTDAFSHGMYYHGGDVGGNFYSEKEWSYSVRCVKD